MTEQTMPAKLGRYEVVRELGKGAMGVVYEGRDPNIGRRVAIKTARRDVLQASERADELMERFLREARAAGGLNHPNIITIYDAGEENGTAYIAMEFLEGGDLEDYLKVRRSLDPEDAVDICATVCDALAVAHKQGIVHRDMKPANIIMPKGGPIKIADFGIARMSDSSLTQEGSMIGTPYYMSPEQFQGKKVDARSDLFAMGVILYELMTGEKPFCGEALSTVMTAVIKSTPIEPSELNVGINETLNQVVMKAISKDPNKRYQTGEAMAAALREAIKPQPNSAVTLIPTSSMEATAVGGGDETMINSDVTLASATVGGPASSSTIARSVATRPPESAPSPAPAPTPVQVAEPAPKRKPLPFVAAGVVALVVIGGVVGAVMMRGGGEPYFDRIDFVVKGIETQDVYDEWEEMGGLLSNLPPEANKYPVENATIIIRDPVTKAELKRAVTDASGRATLDGGAIVQGKRFSELIYEVSKTGYESSGENTLSASSSGQVLSQQLPLVNTDVDQAL